MRNSVSGNGPIGPLLPQDDHGVNEQRGVPKPVAPTRYISQASEDEGYSSDSVEKISDRKVEANPGKPLKTVLQDFNSVFADVRSKVKRAATEQRIEPRAMPNWYRDHVGSDPRYPVAFVRALQHMAPDVANDKELKAEVQSNLAEVEAHLSPDEELVEDPTLQEISSRELIDLVEAEITYHVLLGNTEQAKQRADKWVKYHSNKEIVAFPVQDAKLDITRDLRLPVEPKSP